MATAKSPRTSIKPSMRFLQNLRAGFGGITPAIALIGGSLAFAGIANAQQVGVLQPVVQQQAAASHKFACKSTISI